MKKLVPILGIIGGATAIFWWGVLGWVEFTGVKDELDKDFQEELKQQINDVELPD